MLPIVHHHRPKNVTKNVTKGVWNTKHSEFFRFCSGQRDSASTEGEFDLRRVDGPAKPGDYVAIAVLDAAQVRLQAGETVQPGQRLTAGQGGAARALQTRVLDGMVVSEGAPTVGIALEPAADGMV